MHTRTDTGIELRRYTSTFTAQLREDGRVRLHCAAESGVGAAVTVGKSDATELHSWLAEVLQLSGPWWDRPIKDLLADLDELRGNPEAIVASAEEWTQAAKRMAAFSEAAKVLANRAASLALATMAEGEAVEAPSGRWAYVGKVRDGRATIRPEAFIEHADQLPDGYAPRTELRYPTVTQLRGAVKRGILPRELYRELVDSPPLVPGLRWRTLDGDDTMEDEL